MNNYEIEAPAWWVQRWNDLLNSYRFKKRLERARKYAKEGNILGIDFKGPQVLARVQGTAPEPYEVSLSIDPFTDEDWGYVVDTMAQQALYSAQLLAGEMPEDIEKVFTANGLSLFPFTLSDIHSRCSCPDPQNPCKHIGAVYYQLGDRFSEDPFVLFQLRGRTKEQILDDLRRLRSTEVGKQKSKGTQEQGSRGEEGAKSAAMPLDIEGFWQYNEPLDPSLVVIAPPADNHTVLDVLGTIPLTEANTRLIQYFREVYQTVSQQAVMAALNREY
ncbi:MULTISPECIES: SWIM zinc finger family protein [unclassified Coleofasciculus]|uniref:SWIM zinc finger family protein n=1 Tax=unclassified Coleofasciculus TaxID=2692782 RepID=UPI0018813FC4|nr:MULTISPECIES: SWIM zinc finger family protein [unclassified Coleofasciculus]MBE9126718.1 SWIM zinc finger family protein [Coleofasciculus sp. LEGE 07081]MBE9150078.1 SWIM zinc finger family protein [Coleofasciculus sp. LEGE 07092]